MIKKFGLPILIVLIIVALVSTTISTKELKQKRDLKRELKIKEESIKAHTFDKFLVTDFGAYVTSEDCDDTLFLYANKNQITYLTLKY